MARPKENEMKFAPRYEVPDDCVIIKKKSYEDLLNNLSILETDLHRCKAEIINLHNYIKYLRKETKCL